MIKRILLLFVAVSFLAAQDFTGIKIYINPGHGGHDPANDRYIPETGYWESEGNLTKGLYLRDLLQQLNATVYMSRTQNRDVDDLPLSQIDADANAHDVDYFHSIHSNAHNATSNYPLLLFRGYDDDPVFPDAKRMGSIMFKEMNKANHQWTYWPYSYDNNRGDWSFYPQWGTNGLGVLRYLDMPGTLSEGSFHDYLPNSFRLMSIDYRKHESIVILRSFLKYFDLPDLPDGVVAGIVRSKSENVNYSYNYNSSLPNDKKKALNFARVRLMPENRVYLTDSHNNGFFMFENVEPGNYSVIMEAGDYLADTVQVTVTANKTSFANGFLTKIENKPPQVYWNYPADHDSNIVTHSSIEIQFSQPMDETTTEAAFSVEPEAHGVIEWQDGNRKLIFALLDTLARHTTYSVTVDTTAKNQKMIALQETYQFSFTTSEQHIKPKIVDFSPAVDSVLISSTIEVSFDFPMRRSDTENAFSITPDVNGHFEWQDNSEGFTFVPDSGLKRKTHYTVTINSDAKNVYGVSIDTTFQFSFTTRYWNELVALEMYPHDGQKDVSTRPQILIIFNNTPVKYSLVGNIQLMDSTEKIIGVWATKVFKKENRGILVFEPVSELERNMAYTVRLFPRIKDTEGLPMADTLVFSFRTVSKTYYNGQLIDDFEKTACWVDPDLASWTYGTDPENTFFDFVLDKKISGAYGGRLNYQFTVDSAGVCHLLNGEGRIIPATADSLFGLWIFGDYSHNLLQILFDRTEEKNVVVWQDTIDWAGWKMVMVRLDSLAGNELNFHSVVLRQLAGGYKNGTLYFDDAQYDMIITALEKNELVLIPQKLVLKQNYPNPFNPITSIVYHLPEAGNVELTLFNVLGQKVKELVREQKTAGTYLVRLNAQNLASGVYIYRLKFKNQIKVKKLIVLK